MRGSLDSGSYLACYVNDGRIDAAVALNRGKDLRRVMPLIKSRRAVDLEQFRDEAVDLRSLQPTMTSQDPRLRRNRSGDRRIYSADRSSDQGTMHGRHQHPAFSLWCAASLLFVIHAAVIRDPVFVVLKQSTSSQGASSWGSRRNTRGRCVLFMAALPINLWADFCITTQHLQAKPTEVQSAFSADRKAPCRLAWPAALPRRARVIHLTRKVPFINGWYLQM